MLNRIKKWIIFLILSLITLYFISYKPSEKEPFYCPDCFRNAWVGHYECMQCSNCGWCVDNYGTGSCGVGDQNGPYFKDCRSWYYRNVCIFGPDCITSSYSWLNPFNLIPTGVHSFPVFFGPRRRPGGGRRPWRRHGGRRPRRR